MSKTYDEWLKYYEGCNKEQVIFDIMLDGEEIERLNNEIKQYKEYIKELKDSLINYHIKNNKLINKNEEKDKEIERLNNIINEFDKWLDEEYQYADKHIFPGSMAGVAMGQINRTKNKLQELKGEDKK